MSDQMSTATTAVAPSKGRVFFSRLASTVFLWSVIIVALCMKLDWLMLLMMALVGILGTWEYVRLQQEDVKARGIGRFVVGLSVVYWVALFAWYGRIEYVSEPPAWLDVAMMIVGFQGVFAIAFRHNLEGEHTLRRIFNGIFGVFYTIYLWGFMAKLLLMYEVSNGQMMVLTVILVTKFGDMGAYLFGSLFGKHKMIPHISPAKTWEGFGGAIFSSCLGMCLLLWLIPAGSLQPLEALPALFLAPILAVLGVMGDLAESVLKRCHQIKDSGQKLPGIGGILDLTDSLLFTAPVAYLYVILLHD